MLIIGVDFFFFFLSFLPFTFVSFTCTCQLGKRLSCKYSIVLNYGDHLCAHACILWPENYRGTYVITIFIFGHLVLWMSKTVELEARGVGGSSLLYIYTLRERERQRIFKWLVILMYWYSFYSLSKLLLWWVVSSWYCLFIFFRLSVLMGCFIFPFLCLFFRCKKVQCSHFLHDVHMWSFYCRKQFQYRGKHIPEEFQSYFMP